MQVRAVLLAIGVMTMLIGAAMLPSAAVDFAEGREEWPIFALSAFGSIFIGTCLYVMSRGETPRTGPREAFLLVVLVWLILPAIAAIPFVASGMSITNAVFESVSGLTTTGATVVTGLDDRPQGFLLWRAILQWIGGIGIIVTAIAILPTLRVGGMQLFQIESTDVSGKFLPRVTEIATQTGFVYLFLTALCAILYNFNGMEPFDAIAHAMTTMAAGGFSTTDSSFMGETNGAVSVAILFMILAGLPFAAFVMMARGQWDALWRDPQPRLFLAILIAAIALLMVYDSGAGTAGYSEFGESLRQTAFNVVSVMTGTGYASADYNAWGPGAVMLFLILMFFGGCAGSAACGIKIFRIEIAAKTIVSYARRMVRPNRLAPVRYSGKIVSEDTQQSVMVFIFLYLATFFISAALLALTGLDAITAISGAATSVSNVGPGLGDTIGPTGTFQTLPVAAKWICAVAMLLGRLEFVAIFVLMTRRFWRD
ncbi:MAG: TrkH family potassium uptake protein [Pseudomonadota bacterium]